MLPLTLGPQWLALAGYLFQIAKAVSWASASPANAGVTAMTCIYPPVRAGSALHAVFASTCRMDPKARSFVDLRLDAFTGGDRAQSHFISATAA